MTTIIINTKKEMSEVVRTLYPNSDKKIAKINDITCNSFDFSNKTVTVYTGETEYVQFDLKSRVSNHIHYPVTITITNA